MIFVAGKVFETITRPVKNNRNLLQRTTFVCVSKTFPATRDIARQITRSMNGPTEIGIYNKYRKIKIAINEINE